VNVGKLKIIIVMLLVLGLMQQVWGEPARVSLQDGNKLYGRGNYNEAINKYDEALIEEPQAMEPRFNKGNSYYRLDDLVEAQDWYREVAAESKDMELVTKAKYNLGNTYFQQGMKQRDSNLQKALEDLQTSIGCWRGVLDIEPENEKAARNIEAARLIIKDIIDQLNKQKQQQDPNQPQDPNQSQQQQQQSQDQQGAQQDPNQTQQQAEQTGEEDPNQEQDEQAEQKQEQEKADAPDATAQEILDKEQRQREERQLLQRAGWQKVEKDW
jgi:Ca-activated chloride channel family protein